MNTLTLNQAAELLKLHPQTVLQRARSREIPAAKLDKCWVFIEDDLIIWLRSLYNTNGDARVIGGAKTIVQAFPMLPSALPNAIVATGARYDKLPTKLQQHIRYSFGKDIEGYMISPIDFAFAKVNNQKLTLSFKPATEADELALKSLLPTGEITDLSQLPQSIPSYLIKVIPELKLNGLITVKTGNAMKLGEEVPFVTGVNFAGRGEIQNPRTYNAIAGSYLSVNAIAGNVSPHELNNLKTKLEQTKAKLESKDQVQIAALTQEDLPLIPFMVKQTRHERNPLIQRILNILFNKILLERIICLKIHL